jgi:hypothetical protein
MLIGQRCFTLQYIVQLIVLTPYVLSLDHLKLWDPRSGAVLLAPLDETRALDNTNLLWNELLRSPVNEVFCHCGDQPSSLSYLLPLKVVSADSRADGFKVDPDFKAETSSSVALLYVVIAQPCPPRIGDHEARLHVASISL